MPQRALCVSPLVHRGELVAGGVVGVVRTSGVCALPCAHAWVLGPFPGAASDLSLVGAAAVVVGFHSCVALMLPVCVFQK